MPQTSGAGASPHAPQTMPPAAQRGAPGAHAGEAGFTLVEVLVGAVVLLVGVLGLLTVLDSANARTATVRAREGATTLARQVTEAARSVPYAGLTAATAEGVLQQQPGLGGHAGASWTIRRRGITYQLSAAVCAVDDPADGAGVHAAGEFCPGAAAGAADRTPDDYKRVRVDVAWGEGSAVRRVRQVAIVSNPGSTWAPAVEQVELISPSSSPVTADVASVGLAATTAAPAASIAWSVDGAPHASATGSATGWTFTWDVGGIVDGTHLVTAQAFDASGAGGPTRSLTVTLNRFAPEAPAGLVAGRNGDVVEFEWLSNAERDIVGYRVVREVAGGEHVEVCAVRRATTCQDRTPPAGTLAYRVVAEDLDPSGARRAGAASPAVTVATTNRAPFAPPELTATSDGAATTLRWTAAEPADPDGGRVAFYRIYRDGTAYADRYDRTGTGSEVSFVDANTEGVAHRYWVVAVDDQLAESPAVGPVTR